MTQAVKAAFVMEKKYQEKKAEVAKNEASREHPVPSKTKETALG